jgi:hypothetical protein
MHIVLIKHLMLNVDVIMVLMAMLNIIVTSVVLLIMLIIRRIQGIFDFIFFLYLNNQFR